MKPRGEQLNHLKRLTQVGIALSTEKSHERLLETILLEAKDIANADGGTVYLRTEEDQLRFAIMRTDSLGIALGGTTGKPITLPQIPLFDTAGQPNHHNVATHAALEGVAFNIPDAYDTEGFDFSGTKKFDTHNGYRSKSFLTIPMKNKKGSCIGVLQLLNAMDPATDEVIPFSEEIAELVESLASLAAVALENQMLLEAQKTLLDSFIRLIADAIDRKSPYTGGHCKRVPLITEMLAREACLATTGPLADFNLSDEDWEALHIAAWLHDCGKIVTPVHVMDKATKLETIYDRIGDVETRFDLHKAELEIRFLRAAARKGANRRRLRSELTKEMKSLDDDLAFLRRVNNGGEFLPDDAVTRVEEIAQVQLKNGQPLLTEDEVYNLTIRRGTLTVEERTIINDHIVHTIEMLENLPFPKHLERVPEYAGGHHEKMDGTGYPQGLTREQLSVPARVMIIADVFEALTATDRPYKAPKKLSEAMTIMGYMKRDNHIDADLFDLFVNSGTYKKYAARHMPKALVDKVDERALLEIVPHPRRDLQPGPDRETSVKKAG